MTESGRLTILLTLKDRVPFTHRWLAYAASAGLPFRILIADGGSDDAVARIVAEKRYAGIDVEYVRYPLDKTYADYYAKLADALSRVTTPFVVLADNDDLFIPDGLARAVQFLSEHPAYVACGGQCAVFWVTTDRPTGHEDTVYGGTVEWKCSSQMHSDVAETARERLRDQSMVASDVFYDVHRTELLRRQFQIVREFNPRDLFLVEHLVAVLTAIAGKKQQLDLLYIARQQNSPGSSAGAHQERFGDWFNRMLLPTWSEDFTRLVDIASEALARADGLSPDDARLAVVASYKMTVAPFLLSDLLEEPTVTPLMPLVLQVVRRLVKLPGTSIVRRVVQKLYRRTRWVSHDLVHGTEFRTRRARDSAGEFKPVYDFLTGANRHNS